MKTPELYVKEVVAFIKLYKIVIFLIIKISKQYDSVKE